MIWFGSAGQAFCDRWSLIHLAFWAFVCGDMAALGVPLWAYWLIVIAGAFTWEVIEQYVFERWLKMVRHPETMLNRWVSDPLMAVLMGLIFWPLMRGQ